MADTEDGGNIYRYIDQAAKNQNDQIKLMLAPIEKSISSLEIDVNGNGDGIKSLRELIRTHTHTGMVSIDRRTVVALFTIAASVATVIGFAFQVLQSFHGGRP